MHPVISFADPQNEALTEDAASDAEASANHRVAIVSFCPLGQPRLEHEFRNLRNLCVGVYSLMHDPRHEDPKTSSFLKSADDGGEPQEELRYSRRARKVLVIDELVGIYDAGRGLDEHGMNARQAQLAS